MIHHLKFLKDKNGDNFVGIPIDNQLVEPFLKQMCDILGDNSKDYINLQQTRDHGKYHLTFMSVMEFNEKSKNLGFDNFFKHLDHLFQVNIDDLKLIGLGKAEKSENQAFYVVCESELLDNARLNLDLPEKDFHITLGFKWKDVHNVPKKEIYNPNLNFLEKLKKAYNHEGQSFEFIKGLKNFDLDFFKLIEPIKINDTTAIFRCGMNDYLQISLIDGQFIITAKWQDESKQPILATTLIERKFKQIK
jgi:hypothetical protein